MASPSYGQILKSTAFTGGASFIVIALNLIRTKFIAVILGPSGVGLIGLYTSITTLASTVSGMGVCSSGVRQIAEAAGTGDQQRIARTTAALFRTSAVLGATGALVLAAISGHVSTVTFGNTQHAAAIAMLALAVLLSSISAAQATIVQGLRRIADLARINIFGALIGTVASIPFVILWRERGILPMLLVMPAAALCVSWWYARRAAVPSARQTWLESLHVTRALLGLGVAFMVSGLMGAAVAYLTRLLIVRELGLDAAGHYSASFALAGVYAGFILQAMGSDFYPRLTAVANDHPTINRFVNEQTEIALLMAVPGIMGTLVLAPWVIRLFYDPAFAPAVPVLQWQVLGILGRVISWPIGFILLAKGRGNLFLLSESLSNALHVALVWLLISRFGIVGAGMAFAGMYVLVTACVFLMALQLTGFRWSGENIRLLSWMLPAVTGVFLAAYYLPPPWSMTLGLGVTAVVGVFCLKGVLRRVPAERLRKIPVLSRWAAEAP